MNTLIYSAIMTLFAGLAAFGQEAEDQPVGREFGMATIPFGEGNDFGVEILDFRHEPAGVTMVFSAEEGKDYMIWCSQTMNRWQFGDMAGCVGPGIYSAHVEHCADWRRAFFLVIEVKQGQVLNQNAIQRGLQGAVPLLEELEPGDPEKGQFDSAVGELTKALLERAAAEAELERQRRERADCLAEVERLRLAAEAATQQTDAAIAYRETAEAEFEEANGHKTAMEDRLAQKKKELEEWRAYAETEIPNLQRALANANSDEDREQLEREIKFIEDALERREGVVELAERDLRDAEERLTDPQRNWQDAVTDEVLKIREEQEAWDAYQHAKDLCGPKAAEVTAAEQAAKEADEKVTEETEDFDEAAAAANEKAEQNRKDKEEAEAQRLRTATALELQRRAEQDQRAKDELERKLAEWKKFFDRVRELGGEEEAKKAAERISQRLKVGTETGRMMSTALKALATGKTVAQAMQGITAATMRLGYTALVEYAASVAKNAVANMIRGRAAEIAKAEADTMKNGESRFISDATKNSSGRTAMVVTRKADGSVVVTSWTKATAGASGGFREDVFKK